MSCSIEARAEQQAEHLRLLCDRVWAAAEIAGEETVSAGILCEALQREGFSVQYGLGSQPTAFRAAMGRGSPVIGLIAEYDALPGLSQKPLPERADAGGAGGHGCGHNLLGAASVFAAILLAQQMREAHSEGTVVLYGTPAEETMFGKNKLLEEGYLADVDVMLSWHPKTNMRCGGVSHSAMNSIRFTFHGRSAHAAANPEYGRSALDAAELMNVGANYLREHVSEHVRFHYSYTNGGEKPNIVPDLAQVWYFVRARTKRELEEVTRRLTLIAEGAAHMTETQMQREFLVRGTHTVVNDELSRLAWQCAQALKPLEFSSACQCFAEQLHQHEPQIQPDFDTQIPEPARGAVEYETGSTDLSSVSHVVPTIELAVTCLARGTPGHHWTVTAQAGHETGRTGALYAAKWLACMGWELMCKPEYVQRVRNEFKERIDRE